MTTTAIDSSKRIINAGRALTGKIGKRMVVEIDPIGGTDESPKDAGKMLAIRLKDKKKDLVIDWDASDLDTGVIVLEENQLVNRSISA